MGVPVAKRTVSVSEDEEEKALLALTGEVSCAEEDGFSKAATGRVACEHWAAATAQLTADKAIKKQTPRSGTLCRGVVIISITMKISPLS
jgi:hypothetical protein